LEYIFFIVLINLCVSLEFVDILLYYFGPID